MPFLSEIIQGIINAQNDCTILFQSSDFTLEDKILLFDSADPSSAFEQLDTDGDGEVMELMLSN